MSKKKCWRFSAGERPHTVEVFERTPGGIIYARVWDPAAHAQVKQTLGHRDRELARQYAQDEAAKLREGAQALAAAPTVGYLLMQYLVHRTPRKGSDAVQREDRRRAELWRRVLGVHKQLRHLGRAEWESFITARGGGAIDARGNVVATDERAPVEPRTVDADLVFMVAVMNWATSWTINGRPILDRNPWGAAAAGVKRALERPKTLAPKRPLATYDRFLTIRAAAGKVLMGCRESDAGAQILEVGRANYRLGEGPVMKWMRPSYLPELMDLVEATGRRISALCRLWYSDLIRVNGKVTKVRWRSMKRAKEKVVPLNDDGRAAIERILAQRPGIGDRPIFPSPKDASKPITRYLAREWHQRAETIAGVEHLEGGEWHPYRRAWATSRKAHTKKDLMDAGGWTDERSLDPYIQADDEMVLAVVNEPRKLVEKKA